MTKRVIFLLSSLALLTGVGVAALSGQGSADSAAPETIVDGPYVEYTEEGFDAASDMIRVYFFHATWCPSCRGADREINRRIEEIPEGVKIFKTDYDSNTELKKMFGVTYQHTFVAIDAEGNQLTKWTGGDMEKILSELAAYL